MKKLSLTFILIISFCFTAIQAQDSISFTKKGNGRPLIFLPALGCKGTVWDNTVNELSKSYTCYEVGIAGFGGVLLKGGFSLEKISKALIKLAKDENLQNPVLIGHSFSGFLALFSASENPGFFSKLIIIDSSPFALASIYPSITEAQAKQQGEIVKDYILKETKDDFEKSERNSLGNLISDESDFEKVLSWVMSSDRSAIAEATCKMISSDLRDKIKNIDCPALIIGTWKGKEKIGFTNANAQEKFEEQYKKLKNKSIVITDNSKHFVMLDDPKWLNKQITGFISE